MYNTKSRDVHVKKQHISRNEKRTVDYLMRHLCSDEDNDMQCDGASNAHILEAQVINSLCNGNQWNGKIDKPTVKKFYILNTAEKEGISGS